MLSGTRTNAGREIWAASAALVLACASLFAPSLALLGLAALASRALAQAQRFELAALAGPVLAAVAVGAFTGLAGAIGVIFVWRLSADARWSVAEAARLARRSGRQRETGWRALAHAWATPLHGLALVAYTAPHTLVGLPLDLPHAPIWAPIVTALVAFACVIDWALRRAAEWRLGELAKAPAAHLLTHHAMFLLAFGVGFDVTAGLVAVSAWRLASIAAPAAQPSLTAVP
jgi:hypothetical protein